MRRGKSHRRCDWGGKNIFCKNSPNHPQHKNKVLQPLVENLAPIKSKKHFNTKTQSTLRYVLSGPPLLGRGEGPFTGRGEVTPQHKNKGLQPLVENLAPIKSKKHFNTKTQSTQRELSQPPSPWERGRPVYGPGSGHPQYNNKGCNPLFKLVPRHTPPPENDFQITPLSKTKKRSNDFQKRMSDAVKYIKTMFPFYTLRIYRQMPHAKLFPPLLIVSPAELQLPATQ